MIKAILCLFFTQLARDYPCLVSEPDKLSTNNIQAMKKAINYISDHYSEKITLSDISFYTTMSQQHFCRLFKTYTGKTFTQFITHHRLERANLLLLKTDLPVTQVPELTGFCNFNYFARVYKHHYGHAPSLTRKKVHS